MTRYRCAFSYYGGKSKIAHLYPEPEHGLIIEPFAGGGSYSLRYADRDVILNDLNPKTIAIWRTLTSDEARDLIETIPEEIEKGTDVRELTDHPGLLEILRSEANQGTQGTNSDHNIVTTMGASRWHVLRRRLLYWIPRIRHWQITSVDYRELPDATGTWFVDPPYAAHAGRRYRHHEMDYDELARWVQSRSGQVIACESEGANYLPFRHLCAPRGVMSQNRTASGCEVVYVR